ncbi:hypothetical protein [Bordetella sp. FB-8]|uniref:hypothetical protein n=1 Tax=Bordetella sp. FB-8 TaxID=1159870 RepID=UPI00038152E0|nr:hypothetical protein [Bordetella sp. FB-8]
MPVVTLTVADAPHYSPQQFDRFVECAEQLCLEVLKADANKVQIQVIGAIHPLHGRAAYLSVQYRNSAHRADAVMQRFMQELDALCRNALGIDCTRIRCFPQESHQLYARN